MSAVTATDAATEAFVLVRCAEHAHVTSETAVRDLQRQLPAQHHEDARSSKWRRGYSAGYLALQDGLESLLKDLRDTQLRLSHKEKAVESLHEVAEGLRAELADVDRTLGNVAAFDACTTRVEKIALAMATAKRADEGEHANALLTAEVERLTKRFSEVTEASATGADTIRELRQQVETLTQERTKAREQRNDARKLVEELQDNLAGRVLSPTQPLTLAKWIEMGTKTFGWRTEMRQVNSYTQCTVLVSPHEVRPS